MASSLSSLERLHNRRFLRWLRPEDGETLPSFLFRLGQANFYDPPRLVQMIWHERLQVRGIRFDSPNYPVRRESYHILQELTGLSEVRLYQLSGQWLARTLTAPDLPWATLRLPSGQVVPALTASLCRHHLHPVRAAPYCPLCLAEARYYPLAWLTDLAVCLRHQVLLQDVCPACQAPLAVPTILSGYCARCEADLLAVVSCSVAEDPRGLLAQRHLAAWLGVRGESTPLSPLPGLPVGDPRTLYALYQGLHRCLRLRPLPQTVQRPAVLAQIPLRRITQGQPVPPGLHYLLTATVVDALTDWPEGFLTFLEAYRAPYLPSDPSGMSNLRRQFGPLYQFYLQHRWQHPVFQFVQSVFDGYFLGNFADYVSLNGYRRFHTSAHRQPQQPHWIARPLAAQILGNSVANVEALVRRGVLTVVQQHPVVKVDRQQVLAFKVFRETHISLRQVTRDLGLSPDLVKQLIHMGYLHRRRFPGYMSDKYLLNGDEVQAFQQRLWRVLRPHPPAEPLYTLPEVFARVGPRHVTAAQVLEAILDGHLPAYRVGEKKRIGQVIRVAAPDLRHFWTTSHN